MDVVVTMRDPSPRRWPWFGHRTLAEVAETDRLLTMPLEEIRKRNLSVRFDNLLRKARVNNPPPADEPVEAA